MKLYTFYLFLLRTICLREITSSERESHAAEELVAGQPIVIPDGELQGPFGQIGERHILVDERVVPHGIRGPLDDGRFLLGSTILIGKKVTASGEGRQGEGQKKEIV